MSRQITLLALMVLLTVSASYAANPADETGDSVAPTPGAMVPEVELAAIPSADDGIPSVPALPLEAVLSAAELSALEFTAAEESPREQSFGSCYTGCYPQLDSICSSGQVAEVTATGPISNCGLADVRCVDRCTGPVLRCSFFASCF
ncbi:MAG: hypothetical protein MI919_42540 [Holophagales bacterium]|nr:hypothetical protein [Holophagales bacterium]